MIYLKRQNRQKSSGVCGSVTLLSSEVRFQWDLLLIRTAVSASHITEPSHTDPAKLCGFHTFSSLNVLFEEHLPSPSYMPRIRRVCWDTVTGEPQLRGADHWRKGLMGGASGGGGAADRAEGSQEESPRGRFDPAPRPEALLSSDGRCRCGPSQGVCSDISTPGSPLLHAFGGGVRTAP